MAKRLFPGTICWTAVLAGLAFCAAGRAQTVRPLQDLETRRTPHAAEPASQAPLPAGASFGAPSIFERSGFLDADRLDDPSVVGPSSRESLFDNLSLFLGLDGSKQPQDLGINAHLGGRFAINWGFPLLRELGVGGQLGTSLNSSNNAVHVLDQIEGTSERWQSFTTVGLFQRTAWGLSWGVAYDFLSEHYFENFDLSLWRGAVGYALGPCDDIGVWLTVADRGDHGFLLGTPVRLQPITQANMYWQHTWASIAQTTMWMGMAERHGEVVFVFPRDTATKNVFVYGAEIHVPLNDRLALFGAANFLTPADTGTVDAYLGFAFYPAGGARQVHQRQFAPLFPVANNPTFAVDFRR